MGTAVFDSQAAVPLAAQSDDEPEEESFILNSYSQYGDLKDELEITREEYEAVRNYIALMRSAKEDDYSTVVAIKAMSHYEEDIRIVASMLEEANGWVTPADQFLEDVLFEYRKAKHEGRGVKPEQIEGPLESFRRGIDSLLEYARKAIAEYPDLLAESPAPEGAQAQ